ncbi:single-stranded DNA-binding protein [Flavobacteriaceae bacterium (ex Bugula neritina AB1)]|nr:single-stranded DNA-binding protein [Flavobacteriaceae bacterium (ex Bugula neritina AB1)]
MLGVNRVTLVGFVGKDPEIRATQAGALIASLSIATSERYKDKQGQKQESTEWHKVVVFGKLSEVVQMYVKKGSQLYVEGKLKTRKWTDKQGQDRYVTEIVVDSFNGRINMLGNPSNGHQQHLNHPPAQSHPERSPPAQANQVAQPVQNGFDDDIPF